MDDAGLESVIGEEASTFTDLGFGDLDNKHLAIHLPTLYGTSAFLYLRLLWLSPFLAVARCSILSIGLVQSSRARAKFT
jgi:hypothetical protein